MFIMRYSYLECFVFQYKNDKIINALKRFTPIAGGVSRVQLSNGFDRCLKIIVFPQPLTS